MRENSCEASHGWIAFALDWLKKLLGFFFLVG